MVCSENLRDSRSAIVSNQIHGVDFSNVKKLFEHCGLSVIRNVLVRCALRGAVREEINRYASANVTELLELMTPEIAIKHSAVKKQSCRACTALDISDTSRWSVRKLSPGFEFGWGHVECSMRAKVFSLKLVAEYLCRIGSIGSVERVIAPILAVKFD